MPTHDNWRPLTVIHFSARRHSTVDMKVETKTRSNGGGDDNETTASNTGGDSEKPVETNNEASQLSVAENCSPSIEVQGDIKSAVSHADVDESQTSMCTLRRVEFRSGRKSV